MANYNNDRLILVTNDDAYDAPGITALIEIAARYGRVVAVAPKEPQSGKSQAITTTTPLMLTEIYKRDNVEVYALNGTPVDCVKFATDHLLLGQKIDLVVSGINHGSNAAINVLYSGTMGAAIESSMYVAPSIGFSHISHSSKSDLTAARHYTELIINNVIDAQPKGHTCWNVNFPDLPLEQIKGIKVVRQNRGYWLEKFFERQDPRGNDYYWLTGDFVNTEPEATDTDIAALEAGYVSIVPIQVDMTAYDKMAGVEQIVGL
ncbi:MAG: 5'/3'-nucleotidase SurE [Rikenellaceae bacterium]